MGAKPQVMCWLEREHRAAIELEQFLDRRVGHEDCFEVLLRRYLGKLVRALDIAPGWQSPGKVRLRLSRAHDQIRCCKTVLDFLCNERDITHEDHLRALALLQRIEPNVKASYESATVRVSSSNERS
jgi:hypothetical protein